MAMEWAIRQREERWTTDREIAAATLETAGALLHAFLRSKGAKSLGKPIHVERPYEREAKKAKTTFGAFVADIGAAVIPVG